MLPLVMLAAYWLCVIVTTLDPKNKEQSNKVLNMVLWIFPVFSLIINSIVYLTALGMDINIDVILRILLGMMFVVIGNYLPKCKQNSTIGIKVKWTLRNEENWNHTHRFSGKVWMAGGIIMIASLLIPVESFIYVVMGIVVIIALLPL